MNAQKHDSTGRLLGILYMLGGVGMLCITFIITYRLYSSPLPMQLNPDKTIPLNINELVPNTLNLLYGLIYKSVLLVIMGIIGGILTTRGIKLFSNSTFYGNSN